MLELFEVKESPSRRLFCFVWLFYTYRTFIKALLYANLSDGVIMKWLLTRGNVNDLTKDSCK